VNRVLRQNRRVFLRRKRSSLHARVQLVAPPQPTRLARPPRQRLGDRGPVPRTTESFDLSSQQFILLFASRARAFVSPPPEPEPAFSRPTSSKPYRRRLPSVALAIRSSASARATSCVARDVARDGAGQRATVRDGVRGRQRALVQSSRGQKSGKQHRHRQCSFHCGFESPRVVTVAALKLTVSFLHDVTMTSILGRV